MLHLHTRNGKTLLLEFVANIVRTESKLLAILTGREIPSELAGLLCHESSVTQSEAEMNNNRETEPSSIISPPSVRDRGGDRDYYDGGASETNISSVTIPSLNISDSASESNVDSATLPSTPQLLQNFDCVEGAAALVRGQLRAEAATPVRRQLRAEEEAAIGTADSIAEEDLPLVNALDETSISVGQLSIPSSCRFCHEDAGDDSRRTLLAEPSYGQLLGRGSIMRTGVVSSVEDPVRQREEAPIYELNQTASIIAISGLPRTQLQQSRAEEQLHWDSDGSTIRFRESRRMRTGCSDTSSWDSNLLDNRRGRRADRAIERQRCALRAACARLRAVGAFIRNERDFKTKRMLAVWLTATQPEMNPAAVRCLGEYCWQGGWRGAAGGHGGTGGAGGGGVIRGLLVGLMLPMRPSLAAARD